MDVGAKLDTSTPAAIIWIVRILLPILLFWIWYRTQPSKGPTGCCYSRAEFLDARKASETNELPVELQGLRLVDEWAIGGPPPRAGSGTAGTRRDSSTPRPKRGSDKARLAGDVRKGSGLRDGEALGSAGADPEQARLSEEALGGAAAVPEQPRLSEEERMHLESLLNFVAFSHKEQPQRTFLHDEDRPPPPPPRRPASGSDLTEASPTESARANSHAQLVLKGVLNPQIGIQGAEVAKTLHRQLEESQVRLAEATFSLMVETCVAARDLRGASNFLMQMETAGHSADSSLLDKVMDLYAESGGRGNAASAPPAPPTPLAGDNGGEEEEEEELDRKLPPRPGYRSSGASSSAGPRAGGGPKDRGGGRAGASAACWDPPAAEPDYGTAWSDDDEDGQ